MKRFICAAIAFFFLAVLWQPFARAEDKDLIIKSMTDEIKRSMDIKAEEFDPPYFVSFQILSSRSVMIGARFGAIFSDRLSQRRDIYAEVRVGNYSMDSSGKGGNRWAYDPDLNYEDIHRYFRAPTEDNSEAIRGQLWLAADNAYKNALAQYLGKKGKAIYQAPSPESERFDDFSKEKPQNFRGPDANLNFDHAKWRDFVKRISEDLKKVEEIVESDVDVRAEIETRYFANSEGALVVEDDALFTFRASALTYADDGMRVRHAVVRYAGSDKSMPTEGELRDEVMRMIEELKALRAAPVIDPYTGPALLDGQMTGVLFHEAVGHRLEGERMRDTQEGQTFKDKIGQSVLPSFITIRDDPTMRFWRDTELNGYYRFDNEGIAAQNVLLVENGVLRNYLLSRAPIAGFEHSNGHGRSNGYSDPMARMANLIIEPAKTLSKKQLKKMLMKEVRKQKKPYGLILRRAKGGETSTNRVNFQAFANRPTLIYKVDPKTGRETLVRGAELVGTPLITISKIMAMDDSPQVFNGFCGAESGAVPVSSIAPASLVAEIELQRSSEQPMRPPLLPAPFDKSESDAKAP